MDNSPCNPRSREHPCASPRNTTTTHNPALTLEVASTPEIQKWMSAIEQHLSEVTLIAQEGKLNQDQKSKIFNLCRKIGVGTSQMAVEYQSLKQKAIQAYSTMENLQEQRNLTEQISELKQTIKDSHSSENLSFANIVKKGPTNSVRPNNLSSVAIYPNDKSQSNDETKDLVKKIIRPEQMKLHVRGVRKTKNGGVIISTETKQDVDKVKNAVQLSTFGLTADEPNKRKPRIVIIGVPTSMSENEVYRCIFEQNVADKFPDISLESFMTTVKLSHKSGKREASTCNYVIEVPANIRKALISQSRLFVNWNSCPIRDFTLVTRCYKCQQYGHAAKTCRELNSTCGHCGEAGHSMSECTKKSELPKCATCSRFKKPSNHRTGDVECPARKIAESRYINSVDYEGA